MPRSKGRPRGRPPLDPEVRAIIGGEARRDLDEPRKDVQKRIEKALKDTGLPLPKASTLLAEISEARRGKPGPKDSLWTIATLAEYPIPPRALLIVMKAWARALKVGPPLTIRQALWVSRLCYVYPKLEDLPKVSHFNDILFEPGDVVGLMAFDVENLVLDSILAMARQYSSQETAIEMSRKHPVTTAEALRQWYRDSALFLNVTGDSEPAEVCRRLLERTKAKTTGKRQTISKAEHRGGKK